MNFSQDFVFMKILHILYSTSVFISNPINIFPVYETIILNIKI